MPKKFQNISPAIPPYCLNEPLLESQRIELHSIPVVLPVLGDGKQDLDLFEPEKDEFKSLAKGLKFLKFSPEEAEAYYKLIGSGIKIATSIMTVIGAVESVADLAKKLGLLGSAEKSIEEKLEALGVRLEQIYSYLEKSDRRGLYKEARDWRSATRLSRQARWSAQISPSSNLLENLIDRMEALDGAIGQMLELRSGNISFHRSVYGYVPGTFHWIDVAKAPFVGLANGDEMEEYNNPYEELKSEIWDAGHYIDELISSLHERLLDSAVVEPAFRSTGIFREFFSDTEEALQNFIERWRGAFLIANPAACIGQDGELRNPFYGPSNAPEGIIIGATDPVTGISSMQVWKDFPIKYITSYIWGVAYGYGPQRSLAVDPVAALAAGMAEHARLVDQVIKASGIDRLRKLQIQYALLAQPVLESEFVRLPVAKFQFVDDGKLSGFVGEATTIDLGDLKKFTSDPTKTYPATRYFRQMEKTFRFRMARRTEISKIQLGYKLRIDDVDIELCPYSTRPAEGFPSVPFPSEPIEETLSLKLPVADCCQTVHFSAAEEDSFEKEGGATERVFVLGGTGEAEIRVSIVFEPLAGGLNDAHAGEAVVTIRNLRPQEMRDAFELRVTVFETVTGDTKTIKGKKTKTVGPPREFVADYMTIHMTPSYLIVAQDFIDDYWRAFGTMVKTIKGIKDRFTLDQIHFKPPQPMEDPEWNFRNTTLEIQKGINFINAVETSKLRGIAEEIGYFRPPAILKKANRSNGT